MAEPNALTRGERRCLEFITRCDFTGKGVAVTEDELAFHLGYKRPYVSALVNSLAEKGRMSIERRRHPGSPFLHNFYRVTVWNPNVRRGICNLRREFQRLRERSVCKSENRCSDAKRTATALQGSRPGKNPRSFRAGSSTALVARAKNPKNPKNRDGRQRMDESNAEAVQRLPQTDYPGLHAVLDDVLILGVWVQRQALRWMPDPPAREDIELAWLERYLTDLERAAGMAREKVAWRRLLAEAAQERRECRDATSTEEEEWLTPQDLSGSSNAPIASGSGRPSTL